MIPSMQWAAQTELLCPCRCQGCCQRQRRELEHPWPQHCSWLCTGKGLGCWDGKSSRLHRESCHEVSNASLLLTSKTSHIRTSHTTLRRVYRPGIPSAVGNKSFTDPSLENTSRSPKTTRIKDDGWNLAYPLEPYYSDNYWLNVLIFRKIQKHLERIGLPLVIFGFYLWSS